MAKDIVDILLEIDLCENMERVTLALQNIGFIIMSKADTRISMNYGYTIHGFADKVRHLHIRCKGDNDELYFRDLLREHEDIAKEYEKLKISLWKKFPHDRDAYTAAKTDFILLHTEKAKALYANRYA